MSIPVPKALIEKAVKRFQIEVQKKQRETSQQPRAVITISRQFGSGGERIAEILEQWLGWHVWDKEILNVLAHQSSLGYQAKMFESIDEKAQDEIESLMSFMFGQIDKHSYLHLLQKALLVIAQNNAIILGRGAHLFLVNSLKVCIKASLQTRIDAVMQNEGLTRKAAHEQVRAVDQEREGFIKEVCQKLGKKYSDTKNHLHYDLEISTDKILLEEAALLILIAAIKRFNLKINLQSLLKETHLL